MKLMIHDCKVQYKEQELQLRAAADLNEHWCFKSAAAINIWRTYMLLFAAFRALSIVI